MTSKLFLSMRLRIRVLLMVLVLLIGGIWGLEARVAAVVQADLGIVLMQSKPAMVRYDAGNLDCDVRLASTC